MKALDCEVVFQFFFISALAAAMACAGWQGERRDQ
jgi:hypothetical protein